MEEHTNGDTHMNIPDDNSGIASSSNFLGLPPLPYSMAALKNNLPSLQTPPLSSSYVDTYVPQTSTNNNHTSFPFRRPSRSFADLNNAENYSNSMSSSTYRSSSFSSSKPSLFHQTREKERFELSTLNDKFADYVEKVRYLEAQNKKIQMDTNLLSEKQQESCQKIKKMFEVEVSQVKETAERIFKDKNTIFTTAQDAQNSIAPLKHRLTQTFKDCDSSKTETEKVERELSSIEGDILMFKRRLDYQDAEHTQWKQFITRIQRLSYQANNEIHSETLARASCEKTTNQLRLELNELREQHQEKLNDLKQRSLLLASNSTNDRAHIFKSELSSAIRRIRQDFETQNDMQRNELYEQFTQTYEDIARQYPDIGHLFLNEREQDRIKQEEERVRADIQRVRTDSQLLKQKNSEIQSHIRELQIKLEISLSEQNRMEQLQQNEINQWRLKQEKIFRDYEDVVTKQISLENEIETYRNLLEGSMQPVVDNITDEYNSRTANQAKLEQKNSYSSRMTRSASADRNSSASYRANDTNSYTSFMSPKYDNNQSKDLHSSVVDPPTTHRNGLAINGSNENLDVKNNDNDQHTVEKTETVKNASPPNTRPPIILQTRRNN